MEKEQDHDFLLSQSFIDIFKTLSDTANTIEEITQVFLDKLKLLTKSKYGYVNTIDPKTSVATSQTISQMMKRECHTEGEDQRIEFAAQKNGKYPSLRGVSLNERKPFFTNDPKSHQSSNGIPKGHVPIDNFLFVPVISNGDIIAQIALANSQRDYDQNDIAIIEKFVDLYIMSVKFKKSELEHEAEREKFKMLAENIYEGLWHIDKDSITVYVNKRMADLLGYKINEMIGKRLFVFMDEESTKEAEAYIERRKKGIAEQYEFMFIKKDGKKIFTNIETAPLFDRFGKYEGTLANISDITEKKHAEQKIIERDEIFKYIVKHDPNAIAIFDKKMKYIAVNDRYLMDYNVKKEDLIGKDHYKVFPDIPDQWKDLYTRCLSGAIESYEDDLFILTDGTKIYLRGQCMPWHGLDGDVSGIITYAEVMTKRKLAEKTLKESVEFNRRIMETANGGILVLDKDHKITYANQRMADMLSCETDGLIGKGMTDFVIKAERDDYDQKIEERKKGVSGLYERLLRGKDGKVLWTLVSSVPVFGPDGSSAGSFEMFSDITKMKQMQNNLQHRENLLNKIFEILPVGLWITDKNGKLIRSNQKGREIWGAEPLVGQEEYGVFKARRLPSGEEIAPDDWALAHSINKGETVMDEMLEIDTFDGKKKTILNYTAPVIDENGKVEAAVIVNLDISDRTKDQRLLHESEQKYRKLSETAPVGIATFDRSGNMTSYNHEVLRLTGLKKEQMLGKHFLTYNLFKSNDIPVALQIFEDLLQGKKLEPFRFTLENKRNNETIIEFYPSLIEEEGHITGLQLIIIDVTKEVQAEEGLFKSYKKIQETLDSTISTLSSILEIKDPYTGGHQRNVAKLAAAIAAELGMEEEKQKMIYTSALIHDIGKIAIPASILSKPSTLTDIEIAMIQTHPQVGCEIISKIDFGFPVSEIMLQHHERIDGSGYPKGLKGPNIIFEAKILAVADIVEAISNHRPYRAALGIDKALEELKSGKAILYDPAAADACMRLFKKNGFTL